MRSARNQFILLGFICQGLSWDDWVLPLLNTALWIGCLLIAKRNINLGQTGDVFGMLFGCAAGFFLAGPLGASAHFFIGHGLTLLQASRLLRRLERREKIFSLIVAAGQVAVACTVILDYRFIIILFALLYLLPKAFAELETEQFNGSSAPVPFRIGWGTSAVIFGVMLLVFFGSPRAFITGGIRAPSLGGQAPGTMLDDMLDPSFGGRANSAKVILQVEAESISYLRMFALTRFVNGIWEPDPTAGYLPFQRAADVRLETLAARKVRVKNTAYLQRTLPVDGEPVSVTGRFFRGAHKAIDGTVVCRAMWNSANNLYQYWIDTNAPPRLIPDQRQRRYLKFPAPTPAVSNWLEGQTAGMNEPVMIARRIESHLRDTFDYELGVPNLSRLNALEDFLIREKRGHCERFASAMALLLRMKGIPSRVMVGFVPGRKNWLSGWYDIRFRDAHAWVEAYFPDEGWVQFDPTPRGSIALSNWNVAELIDALDVIWYLNIVNFSTADQQGMWQVSFDGVREVFLRARQFAPQIFVFGILTGIVVWLRKTGLGRFFKRPAGVPLERIVATHCYGRMLRLLARHGHRRALQQTPLEFLEGLKRALPGVADEAGLITESFCATRYGEIRSATLDRGAMEAALRVLSEKLKS